jgi:hypothetical protein
MGYLRNKNGVDIYGPEMTTINTDGDLNINVSTTEVNLGVLIIPANTFATGDCINIISRIVKTSTNGVTAIRMRIGTGQTISDTLVGSYTATSATHTMIPIFRTLSFYSGSTNYVLDPTDSLAGNLAVASTVTTVSINWDVQNFLTINGINNSGTDLMNCMFIKTKVL